MGRSGLVLDRGMDGTEVRKVLAVGETSEKFREGRNVALVGEDGGAAIWRRRR